MFRSAVISVPLLFGFLVISGVLVWSQRPDPPPQPNQEFRPIAPLQAGLTPSSQRIREGMPIRNMHVFFQQAGDRITLYTVEGNQRFTCLENLTLERTLRAMAENPERRRYWRIDGTFTEFRGENFVLIRHAVIAPAPEAVVPAVPQDRQ